MIPTPQEKAVELYSKYEQLGRDFTRGVSMHEFAKQCALICCDQVLSDMGADIKVLASISNRVTYSSGVLPSMVENLLAGCLISQ